MEGKLEKAVRRFDLAAILSGIASNLCLGLGAGIVQDPDFVIPVAWGVGNYLISRNLVGNRKKSTEYAGDFAYFTFAYIAGIHAGQLVRKMSGQN